MTDVDEGVDALTTTAVLPVLASKATATAVTCIGHHVAATVGATLLTLGTGVVIGALALAIDAVEPSTGVSAGAAVLIVVHQVGAAVVTAPVALATGIDGVPQTTAPRVGAGVRSDLRTSISATTTVEVVVARINTGSEVVATGLAQSAALAR